MRNLIILVAVIVIIIVFIHHFKAKAKDDSIDPLDQVNPGDHQAAGPSANDNKVVIKPAMSVFKTDGQKHNDVQFMINKILTSTPPDDDSDVFGKGGWKDWRAKNLSAQRMDRSSIMEIKALIYQAAVSKVAPPEHDYYLNYTYPGFL